MSDMVEFTESNIQKLFGNEAAEDEELKRLQEYYFKSSVFQQVVTDLPVRILVGHKGIGKSALFKIAIAEDIEAQKVAISVQPNDIVYLLETETSNFLSVIRQWVYGLRKIIAYKVFDFFGIHEQDLLTDIDNYHADLLPFLTKKLSDLTIEQYLSIKEDMILDFISKPHISVYIDDLDRGWQGRKPDIIRISALLNAIRDLSNQNRGLTFKIALRSDVFYLVRTSDESTDKIEGSVVWHTWTNHEIFVLLVKRIETFFGRNIDENELIRKPQPDLAKYLEPIMEPRFTGLGKWENAPMYRVLMSLIRKRPRDLVKLCTLAARQAKIRSLTNRQPSIIKTEDFKAIFEEYSQGRIQDTINEYRSELPNIEALVTNMKPNRQEREARLGYVYNTAGLLKKIENISQSQRFYFASKKEAYPSDLAAFLYKINFLTARKEGTDGIIRRYFEESRYLSSSFADFGFEWEIHPAYRWALQPDNINAIFDSLTLSSDDD